eukprot:scaffold40356_cov86-Cyclotella_meneghiniana.AAC.1
MDEMEPAMLEGPWPAMAITADYSQSWTDTWPKLPYFCETEIFDRRSLARGLSTSYITNQASHALQGLGRVMACGKWHPSSFSE